MNEKYSEWYQELQDGLQSLQENAVYDFNAFSKERCRQCVYFQDRQL